MTEADIKALKEQIIDMEDKLDEFIEAMQERIARLKDRLKEAEIQKPKVKEYER